MRNPWALPLPRAGGEPPGELYALAASGDGSVLAAGGQATRGEPAKWIDQPGAVHVWSLPDGRYVRALTGHEKPVTTLAMSRDGKTLASGDAAGAVRLWDLGTGELRGFLFDPEASQTDASQGTTVDPVTKRAVKFTLPCGSPVPAGATCTCNCVAGRYNPNPKGPSGNTICTCVPVYRPRR